VIDLKTIILGADDLPVIAAPATPEWPGTDGRLGLRLLSANRRDFLEAWLARVDGRSQRAVGVGLALVDAETGQRVFVGDDAIAALGGKSGLVLDRLYEAVCGQNGIGQAATVTPELVTPAPAIAVVNDPAAGGDPLCDAAGNLIVVRVPESHPTALQWKANGIKAAAKAREKAAASTKEKVA
jgi:hypothetical protein